MPPNSRYPPALKSSRSTNASRRASGCPILRAFQRRVGSYPQTARSSALFFFRCRITSPLPPPQRCSSPLFSNQRATKIVVILRASDEDARRTSISAPRKIQPRPPLRLLLAAICFLLSLNSSLLLYRITSSLPYLSSCSYPPSSPSSASSCSTSPPPKLTSSAPASSNPPPSAPSHAARSSPSPPAIPPGPVAPPRAKK